MATHLRELIEVTILNKDVEQSNRRVAQYCNTYDEAGGRGCGGLAIAVIMQPSTATPDMRVNCTPITLAHTPLMAI